MKNMQRYAIALTICGAAAALAGMKARALANPPAPAAPVTIALTKLIGAPAEYDNQTIIATCRFAATGKLFRQNDRMFAASTHANFAVWAEGARLWDVSARRSTLPSLYIRRDNTKLLKQLNSLRRYDLITITGNVCDTYASMPWIEVTAIQVTPQNNAPLTDAMLSEINKGLELMASANKAEGIRVLQSAVAGGAPEFVVRFVEEQVAAAQPKPVRQAPTVDYASVMASARASASRGDIAGAIELYRKAGSGESPFLKEVWFYRELGQLFLISNDPERLAKARNLFTHANGMQDGKDALALAFLGQIAAEEKDYAQAEDLLNRALKLDAQNALAHRWLTKVIAAQKSAHPVSTTAAHNAASTSASAAATTVGTATSPEQALQRGRDAMQSGDFALAETQLRSALAATDNNTLQQARTLLASVLLAQNRTAEAMKLLEAAPAPKQQTQPTQPPVAQTNTPARTVAAPNAVPSIDMDQPLPEVARDDLDQATREMNRLGKELDSIARSTAAAPAPIAAVANPTHAKPVASPANTPSAPEAVKPLLAVEPVMPSAQGHSTSPKAATAASKPAATEAVRSSDTPVKPITRTTPASSDLPDWAL